MENVRNQSYFYSLKVGEIFEVTKERYEVLTKKNKFNEVFVEEIKEEEQTETAIKKVKTETAVKKTTKKIVRKNK